MPGALDTSVPVGISPALLSAQNLVNSNAPDVMPPSAVQAMTDSMRTGALTAQDVMDRLGELGKTARKAAIEQHKREIADLQDPELVAAKHAITLAGGAQANLAGATAQAQQTLVPAQTQMQAAQLAQGVSELGSGIPSATIRQLNLTYGLGAKFDPQTGVLQNPDEILPNLTHVMGSLNQMVIGKELGDRVDTKKVTDAAGTVTEIPVWKGTGKPLSPTEKNFINRFNGVVPGLLPVNASDAVQPNAPAAAPVIQPNTPTVPVQPTIQTPAASGVPTDASGNLVSAVRTDAEKIKAASDLADTARKQKAVQDWRTADTFYSNAKDAMSAINAVPLADQRSGKVNLNQRDVELAEAVVKMLDPEGAVREFKWSKLADGQPIMDQVHSVMAKIAHTGAFVPEVRQELMKVANGAIRSRESQAADLLKNSSSLGGSMSEKENKLISGEQTPLYAPPGQTSNAPASGAASGVQTRTVPGKGQIVSSDGGKTWNWVK